MPLSGFSCPLMVSWFLVSCIIMMATIDESSSLNILEREIRPPSSSSPDIALESSNSSSNDGGGGGDFQFTDDRADISVNSPTNGSNAHQHAPGHYRGHVVAVAPMNSSTNSSSNFTAAAKGANETDSFWDPTILKPLLADVYGGYQALFAISLAQIAIILAVAIYWYIKYRPDFKPYDRSLSSSSSLSVASSSSSQYSSNWVATSHKP